MKTINDAIDHVLNTINPSASEKTKDQEALCHFMVYKAVVDMNVAAMELLAAQIKTNVQDAIESLHRQSNGTDTDKLNQKSRDIQEALKSLDKVSGRRK